MRELKVGDRVKLRGFNSGGYIVDGKKGRISSFDVSGSCVYVQLDGTLTPSIKEKVMSSQCIRLIKKKRREWWGNVYLDGTISAYLYTTKEEADKNADADRSECIHVREVGKKK